jgi:hypothetical protein
MRRFNPQMLDLFETKARDDPGFAIAYALTLIADELGRYREDMTFGGDGFPGIGEKIGMELGSIAERLGAIGDKLQDD